jgi:hypothetical protein
LLCVFDIQDWLLKRGFRGYDSGTIRRLLQEEWKLQPSPNSNAYLQYRIGSDGVVYEFNQKGRFYSLSYSEVLKLNSLDELDEKNTKH